MTKINLGEFRPIPHHPSYLVHPDGRVASLKKSPVTILSERSGSSLVWRRVRIDGRDWRVRDLVALVFGSIEALEDRTDAEYEEIWRNRQAELDGREVPW